jgi:hypothetical protein
MSKFWKPSLLFAMALILFGAIYASHPLQSRTHASHATAATVSLDEIMGRVGTLPATEIDAQAYQ